ncbi:uncharacterized protein LOC126837312 isoform X2 [Adelges cooleyi]|uniref:uncharacterized protein LOC126837312 isoform X2 n=1 Tax=Adelges cooleyi TaxID=133065 RepID=UPI00217F7D12|nr:uncharacterized protein LOC126837312 isoform X2 [Adelges cooleyi]
MHFNNILFFCVAAQCFLHCQSVIELFPGEQEMIRNAFAKHTTYTQYFVDVHGFNQIIDYVEQILSKTIPKFNVENIELRDYKFAMEEVERIIMVYLISHDPQVTEIVRQAFIQHNNNENFVDVVGLYKIIKTVARNSSKKKPRLDVMKKALTDSKFTMEEVKNILLEYLYGQDLQVLELIKKLFAYYKNNQGVVDVDGLHKIIRFVGRKSSKRKPSLDVMKSVLIDSKFNLDEVKEIICEYLLIYQDPLLREIIRKGFQQHTIYKISFVDVDGLKKIIDDIAKKSRTSKNTPSLDALKTVYRDREFTLDEVENMVLEFLNSQDPQVPIMIREIAEKHGNYMDYEKLLLVVEEVSVKMGITKLFPTLAEFKAAATTYKFPMEEVKRIAYEHVNCNHESIPLMISPILEKYSKPNGISYEELIHFIEEVNQKTGSTGVMPPIEQLEEAYATSFLWKKL